MQLYIHIPFCKKKCAYCDFNSYAGCSDALVFSYLTALKREIAFAGERFPKARIDTVYLGGGTPSLLSTRDIDSLFSAVWKAFPGASPVEVTAEVNPESATEEKLRAFRANGVNRISIGVQSFSDDNLRSVGRLHDAATARAAIASVGRLFDNFSEDFIIGLPYDTEDIVADELKEAAASAPHISVYQLTLEEGTPLARAVEEDRVMLPTEDETADYMELAIDTLAPYARERYEVSNFALNGFESVHNLGYWTREEYLGLGAGAHSLVKSAADGTPLAAEIRFASPEDLNAYIGGVNCVGAFDDVPRAEMSVLTPDEIRAESIMLGLRTAYGIDEKLLEGRDISRVEALFERREGRIRLTRRGFQVMNSVLAEII